MTRCARDGKLPRMSPPAWTSLSAFGLLFAALLLALQPRGKLASQLTGTASMLFALGSPTLELQALPFLLPALCLSLAIPLLPRHHQGWPGKLIALWALAASLHLLPGFAPLIWLDDFGRDSEALLRWHYSKGLAALLLLWALPPPPHGDDRARRWRLLPLCLALPLLAWLFGLAQPDPRWLPGAGLWLLGNLFLTVFAEEVFFRGWLQSGLQRALTAHPHAFPLAVLGSSLLFGLAHLPWGLSFAALSVLAGFYYGWMAGPQRRLGMSICAHLLTNACILILLDSPLG